MVSSGPRGCVKVGTTIPGSLLQVMGSEGAPFVDRNNAK
jgi:hypothetical protein